ncbi:MAG: hypothetical protein LBS72_00020 [Oscillospiraceae bacterium]|jgi:hypothetical protein|nr:hypothetical protein [Oscillospiraceae bacterium]
MPNPFNRKPPTISVGLRPTPASEVVRRPYAHPVESYFLKAQLRDAARKARGAQTPFVAYVFVFFICVALFFIFSSIFR